MMTGDELPDGQAAPSATRTPLEDDPALHDPAAALVVVPDAAAGGAAGTLDVSARAICREYVKNCSDLLTYLPHQGPATHRMC